MLILSRNIGEAILIGNDISITVSNVCKGQVRLAIAAPKHVAVDRAEIRQRKIDNPPSETEVPTCIDDHVRMARDAARYRWLRDRDRIEDADTDLVASRDRDCFYGNALDREIDEAIRLDSLLQKHEETAQ